MRSLVLFLIFIHVIFVNANENDKIKVAIAHHTKVLEKVQNSMQHIDKEILYLNKSIVNLEKKSHKIQQALLHAKKLWENSHKKQEIISTAIIKKMGEMNQLSGTMKNCTEIEKIELYNQKLQHESTGLGKIISTYKEMVKHTQNQQQMVASQNKNFAAKRQKISSYKSALNKKLQQRKVWQKMLVHTQTKLQEQLQEYTKNKKEEEKKRLLVLYIQKQHEQGTDKKDKDKRSRGNGSTKNNGENSFNKNKENLDFEEETTALLLSTTQLDKPDDNHLDLKTQKKIFRTTRQQNSQDNAWMVKTGDLWVYEKPVTNRQYWQQFRKMYYSDAHSLDAPAINISFKDAQEYAKWAGGKIPEYSQMEKLPQQLQGNMWEWTNSIHTKNKGHIIKKIGQKPRLLMDNTEHSQVSFRIVLPK